MPTNPGPLDLETEIAKLTILRHIVASVVSNHTGELWEDYPEIGEHDWQEITQRLQTAYQFPQQREFQDAYEHLAWRARAGVCRDTEDVVSDL